MSTHFQAYSELNSNANGVATKQLNNTTTSSNTPPIKDLINTTLYKKLTDADYINITPKQKLLCSNQTICGLPYNRKVNTQK